MQHRRLHLREACLSASRQSRSALEQSHGVKRLTHESAILGFWDAGNSRGKGKNSDMKSDDFAMPKMRLYQLKIESGHIGFSQ